MLQYRTLFSLSHPPSHPTAAAEADLFAAQYGPRALAEDIVCVEDRHLAAAGKHCESPSPTASSTFFGFCPPPKTLGRDFVRKVRYDNNSRPRVGRPPSLPGNSRDETKSRPRVSGRGEEKKRKREKRRKRGKERGKEGRGAEKN